jgi:mRNA interferase MazF
VAKPTEHGEIWEATVEKRRPVVVVSRDDVRGQRSKTTVAWVTTTIRSVPTEVALDHRDGLRESSVVNCDELATIDKTELVRRVGKLSAQRIATLDEALRFALQLR